MADTTNDASSEPGLTRDQAFEAIERMLQDPDWGVGMLEDIRDLIDAAGGDTSPRYRVVGPQLDALPADAPLDPDLDRENQPAEQAAWYQTGATPAQGYWTTADNVEPYVGDPHSFYQRYDNATQSWVRVPTPANYEIVPVQTWDRH